MAFVKIPAKSGSKKFDVPAITLSKSMCTLNKAFCEVIGLDVTGDTASMDLFYDDETEQFGIFLHKDEEGSKLIKYNKSHQAQVYLRAMFKQHGYKILMSETIKLNYVKKHKMWLFTLADAHKIAVEDEKDKAAVKVLNRKKKKKEKRNKRKNHELGRKI